MHLERGISQHRENRVLFEKLGIQPWFQCVQEQIPEAHGLIASMHTYTAPYALFGTTFYGYPEKRRWFDLSIVIPQDARSIIMLLRQPKDNALKSEDFFYGRSLLSHDKRSAQGYSRILVHGATTEELQWDIKNRARFYLETAIGTQFNSLVRQELFDRPNKTSALSQNHF